MNTKKSFIFLMLFALFTGLLPAQSDIHEEDHGLFQICGGTRVNSPIRDETICVQDRWNNPLFECRDRMEDPRRDGADKTMRTGKPNQGVQPLAPVNCNNGFIITFEDIESNTGAGFDNNTLSPCGTGNSIGQDRVNNVCAVFDYIASVINMGSVNVEIYFPLSEFDGTGPLATASPLFDTGIPAGTFTGGYVRDHIVNQSDPNATAYDGVITMDFGNRISNGNTFTVFSCLTCPGVGDIDMFSTVLHEATHALGFLSFVTSNGTSSYSGSSSGPYSLYDQHLFNASNSDLINGSAVFLGPVADLTSEDLTYFAPGNTQNEPVYSPMSWSPGSSISHFDDSQSNFSYVMRPATSGDDNRLYTMAELEVLVNLGYTLNTGVFTAPQAFNNYVIGTNDVGYITQPGVQVCVPALNNDTDPDGPPPISYGNCGSGCNTVPAQVTLVLGSGTVSIIGNDVCFTPDPWYAGPVIIKYCPTDGQYNSSLVNTDNCTFIEIDVEGPCPGDPCNLVCNGGFENRADNCVTSFNLSTMNNCPSPFIAGWCSQRKSPDILVRGCPGNSSAPGQFDIPNNYWAGYSPLPGLEVWDFPNANNNTYMGMWQQGTQQGGEGLNIELSAPLDVGKTYILTFQASCKYHSGSTPGELIVGFNAGPPPSTIWNQPNGVLDWYAPTNSASFGTAVIPGNTLSSAGFWNSYTYTITPTVAGLDHISFEADLTSAFPGKNYIFLDEVRVECDEPPIQLTKTVSNPTPNPGDIITYTIIITNNHPTNPATNLNIQDLLPAGVTYLSSTLSTPPSNHFIPLLPALTGQLVTITAQVDANPPLGVPITNCAYVTSGNNCLNTNVDNCADIIVGGTDIAVTKALTSGPGPYMVGNNATFQITVTNAGPMDATGVVVQDLLPTGLNYVSHSISGPGSFSYPNLTIANLPNGGTTVLTLNVQVNAAAPCGPLTNCANLLSLNEQDLVISNNSGCDDLIVGAGGGGPVVSFPIHPAGTQREQARGVEWASSGFYVTGYLSDQIDFGFGPMNTNGSIDSYVIKYGSCGVDWQHNEGTPGVETGVAIMENTANGRLYACGNFSQSFNYQGVNLSGSGAYVVELDPATGAAIWGRTLQDCSVEDLDVDPVTGNVAVTGSIFGGMVFAGNPHSSIGGTDIMVAVYDGGGAELWADTYGGAGNDLGYGLVQHSNSRLYVATALGGIPATPFGGTAPAYGGGLSDGFMAVWNPGGIQAAGFYFSTPGDDALNDVDAAPGGDLYIVGNNGGNMNVLGTTIPNIGVRDAMVVCIDQSFGGVNWFYDWGSGSNYEYARAVDEVGGRVFVSGGFLDVVAFPGFPNPTLSSVGYSDVFMVSIVGATGAPINNLQSNTPSNNWIQCWDIDNDGAGNGYIPGWFFRTVVLGGTMISSPSGGTDAFVGRGDGNPGGGFYKATNGQGLSAGLSELELEVFPNPTTGHLTVRLVAGEAEQIKLTLIDLQGRVQVLTEAGVFNAGELELDLSAWAQGLYFLKMETNGTVQTEKLILMRD